MPLISAASLLMALSKAKRPIENAALDLPPCRPSCRGPPHRAWRASSSSPSRPPREWRLWAARRPSTIARSMAFWQMSTLSSSVGAMLIAASVTISTL